MKGRIDRLVLIEPLAFNPWYFKVFLVPVLGRFFYMSAFGNALGRWLTEVALGDPDQKNNLGTSFASIPASTTLGWLSLFDAISGPEAFADLTCAIDLVYGERTLGAIKRSVPIWQAIWPQAEATSISGAGHLLLQESPEQILALLEERL
jgi:pimeloyl-ACP methyl ester carboxylesterase